MFDGVVASVVIVTGVVSTKQWLASLDVGHPVLGSLQVKFSSTYGMSIDRAGWYHSTLNQLKQNLQPNSLNISFNR